VGIEPCAERAEVRQIGRRADLDAEQSEAPEGALRVGVHAKVTSHSDSGELAKDGANQSSQNVKIRQLHPMGGFCRVLFFMLLFLFDAISHTRSF